MTARPSVRFVVTDPAHLIAFGFGAGLSPVAPGTVGTLLAIPIAALLRTNLSDAGYLLALLASFAVGTWAADRTGRDLGIADYGGIVCDEVVAFLLVLFFVGPDPMRQAIAFLLFRLFDIVKLPPASLIDREWHNGLGVMADDIVAALYALLVSALWQRLFA